MLYIYTDLKAVVNKSKGPTGLLKWIVDSLENNNINYKIFSEAKELNILKNKSILIYPKHLHKNLSKKAKSLNKIIIIGPDSTTIQIYSLILYYFPFLRKVLFIKFIKDIFCICFDNIYNFKKSTNLLVGIEDVNFLNNSGGNYKELTHPFLSSTKLKKPLLPENINYKDLVIIGKLKGLPVAYRNLEKPIEQFLIPKLINSNRKLYIFESTGLNISDEYTKHQNIKIIRTNEDIPDDFFRSKIIVNMAICGGGTANRSLSGLYDGGYLFSTKFGMRNINITTFENRVKISRFYPFNKRFYDEILNNKFESFNKKNLKIIHLINDNSERILINNLK